ncbi:MAG: hypothetical protein R3Y19_05630 [Rikenellaceae bacterium]
MRYPKTLLTLFLSVALCSCGSTSQTSNLANTIIPEPVSQEIKSAGQFKITGDLTIGINDPKLEPIAGMLQTLISKSTGLTLPLHPKVRLC